MPRADRKAIIEELEELRGSRVLTYVTSDRNPTAAQIGEDAVRPIFDQLAAIGEADNLDLFIYSRGGALEVPWRIASALRGPTGRRWQILVPFRANSAATLLALGADEIVLGRHGELGPIDPILNVQRMVAPPGQGPGTPIQDTINVEDVMAYLRFVREQAGLTDQEALSKALGMLADRLDAVGLGSVYRTRTHIRDVARRMLTSQKEPPTERVMETIIETLAERVYAHGHAIGFSEALDIGLDVKQAEVPVDSAMWRLLEAYELDMKLREPLDPFTVIGGANGDVYNEDVSIAMIESSAAIFDFRGKLEVKAKRQMPQNLNVSMNINLQLPPGLDQAQLPAALQQLLQQMQQVIAQQAQAAVQQALAQQAPLAGLEVAVRGGLWVRSD